MDLHRLYFEDGFLAFELFVDQAVVGAYERDADTPLELRNVGGRLRLAGIYEPSTGELSIGGTVWLPVKPGQDAVTDHFRPLVMPLIEAEMAKISEEQGRR